MIAYTGSDLDQAVEILAVRVMGALYGIGRMRMGVSATDYRSRLSSGPVHAPCHYDPREET
jgi:hypothetical protein